MKLFEKSDKNATLFELEPVLKVRKKYSLEQLQFKFPQKSTNDVYVSFEHTGLNILPLVVLIITGSYVVLEKLHWF